MNAVPMLVRCAVGQGLHLPWSDYAKTILAESPRPDERVSEPMGGYAFARRFSGPAVLKVGDHDLTEVSPQVACFGYTAYCYACGQFFRDGEAEALECRPVMDERERMPR